MTQLLMPKATAVWLVDNTALTFDQIAHFCHLHPLEVGAIADGESAQGIKGMDPVTNAQISRLVGTTKSTIEQIRNRTHWNSAALQPMDPVTLGLCSQIDLDLEVQRASSGRAPVAPVGDTLLPAAVTEQMPVDEERRKDDDELDADAVFAKLSSLKSDRPQDDEE